jgi:topoisomerase-4 subunit B
MTPRHFKKSVGLNGVGTKAVNALSDFFLVHAVREGKSKEATFQKGEIKTESKIIKSTEENGTIITFQPMKKYFRIMNSAMNLSNSNYGIMRG